LAGYVGLFTGCGALVALSLFLPLPTQFGEIDGVTPGEAVSYSFYVVGFVAFLVAIFVAFGLRNLKGEEGKGWRLLLGRKNRDANDGELDSEGIDNLGKEVRSKHRYSTARQVSYHILMVAEARTLSSPTPGFGDSGTYRLTDCPWIHWWIRGTGIDSRDILIHPSFREYFFHQPRVLPGFAQ
jgi:hypothetical protein